MTGLSPCGEIVRVGDPVRFRNALFAGPADREDLFALYAFNLEIAKVSPMVSEPMIGEIRYQWWRDTLDMIYGGGQVRRHEVVDALTVAVRGRSLPRAPFDALIDARSRDLDPDFPSDENALERYLADTAGSLVQLSMRALGSEADGVAMQAGLAIGSARYLGAVPILAAAGKRPLPGDRIDWRGLREGGADGGFADAVQNVALGGLTALEQARSARGSVSRNAAPALVELAAARPFLVRAGRSVDTLAGLSNAEQSPFRENFSRLWRGIAGRW